MLLPFEKKQVMGIGSGKQDQMYIKVYMTNANGRVEFIMLLRTVCHEHLYLCTELHTLLVITIRFMNETGQGCCMEVQIR